MGFTKKYFAIFSFFAIFFAACGDDSGSSAKNSESIEEKTISGVAQLGPFEKGATISVYELDENFEKTGVKIKSTILNDNGEFSVRLKDFESPYALFKVEGYYRNTITGEKTSEKASKKTILYTFTYLNEQSEININILTHLSHKRAMHLVKEKNMPVAKAKKQAEAEVLKSFGIEEDFDDAETLNIIGNDNQSTALLVMSILMQSDMTETEINERLTNYTKDIKKDGTWDDEKTIKKIADWAYKVHCISAFGTIKDYVKTWNSSVVFSTFEKYVNNFWHHHYGLEVCTDDRINEVRKNKLSASDFEDKYFICRPGGKWKEASEEQVEKFFNFDKDAIDGVVRKINYPGFKACHVYEDDRWRSGNNDDCNLGFGGCTKKREGIIKTTKNTSEYTISYICKKQQWKYLGYTTQETPFDLDTIGWKDSTDGSIRKGNVTEVIYIFDKDAWRLATRPEASLGKCTRENLDSAGYVEKRYGQRTTNPLHDVCEYNMELTHRYYNCPSAGYDSEFTLYYKCDYAVYEDSYDTIYAWSPVTKKCELDKYDMKDGKFIRWKKGKEGETRWGNMWKDDSDDQGFFSYKCQQKCYEFTDGEWVQAPITQCMGLGTCNDELIGTFKEGPVVYSEIKCNGPDYDMLGDECYNILVKIDTLKKTNYICRGNIELEIDEQCDFLEHHYNSCIYNPTPVTGNWDIATETDLKTSQLKCTQDGALVSTETDPDELYVCDKKGFREATKAEKMIGLGCTYFTRDKQYHPKGLKSYFICEDFGNYYTSNYIWYIPAGGNDGTMTDPRDGTVYKTTDIGTKTWMMESLNYADSSNYPSMLERNKCEDDDLDNCKKDGRLYTWSAIIDSVYWASKGKTCGNTKDNDKKCDLPDLVQGICPKGWHVPSIQEWDDLNLWMNMFFTDGYDHYGFLRRDYREYFFWTSTDSTGSTANSNLLDLSKPDHSSDIRSIVSKTKDTHLAVRCVKDD